MLLRKAGNHIALLVDQASLDRNPFSKMIYESSTQGFSTVNNRQHFARKLDFAFRKRREQPGNDLGIFSGTLRNAQKMLVSRDIHTHCNNENLVTDMQSIDHQRPENCIGITSEIHFVECLP